MPNTVHAALARVASLAELARKGRMTIRLGARQIALFHRDGRVFACNNRCPHQGFPLVEGSLAEAGGSGGCVLTCNWHNWKFDLDSGETLVGGDLLRRYPVRVAGDDVLLDPTDPPAAERAAAALAGLRRACERHEIDRMAREVARLAQVGADPLEA
ncbi:MAG: Rieske 2Fe-2S domain-containing protein, partial [Inquilinus sp.]|nr:Rieske 2Fe-2S domain-containing protein [Inquilinus sp.]